MKYAKIIRDSWRLTLESNSLKWLVFFPSFMAVLIFVIEISWQSYLYLEKYKVVENHLTLENFQNLIGFVSDHGLWKIGIFVVFILLFFMFIIPPWIDSVLIVSIKQKIQFPEKVLNIRERIIVGSKKFFKLLELYTLTSIFEIVPILLFMTTAYRYFDTWIVNFWEFFVGYFILAVIVNIFTSFAPYYIVSDNKDPIRSIRESGSLVFLHMQGTLVLSLLMILISLRVLLNVLIIFGIPIGIILGITFLNTSVTIIIVSVLGFALMGISAYLGALLRIFSTSVWLMSFEVFKEESNALSEE